MGRKPKKMGKQRVETDFSEFEEEMNTPVGGDNHRPDSDEEETETEDQSFDALVEECTIRMAQALVSRPDSYYRTNSEVKSITGHAADIGFTLAEDIRMRKEARAQLKARENEK